MDSHHSLQADFGDPYSRWSARRESRHIESIKHTVEYYRKKFGKPVFLIGHSNGTLSLAELLNQSPENQKLISGLIFSGSRNETEVKQKISVPVLVLHHKSDSNRWTTLSIEHRGTHQFAMPCSLDTHSAHQPLDVRTCRGLSFTMKRTSNLVCAENPHILLL
jgi:dienelactone hydrolase